MLWLNDPNVVLWSIIIANTWRFVGITMVLYFVNMNAVSKDVLEGATLDGANDSMEIYISVDHFFHKDEYRALFCGRHEIV